MAFGLGDSGLNSVLSSHEAFVGLRLRADETKGLTKPSLVVAVAELRTDAEEAGRSWVTVALLRLELGLDDGS